ncbi:hypothetical protein BKA70DRAFT_1335659 [Coprinopsis sp. MPI-PUGE-AT-0042]|nr:hypothetical protein BKA70DRAFT_1335659 [Coprinopsis sp. MPI-PUGE-AT-0042]
MSGRGLCVPLPRSSPPSTRVPPCALLLDYPLLSLRSSNFNPEWSRIRTRAEAMIGKRSLVSLFRPLIRCATSLARLNFGVLTWRCSPRPMLAVQRHTAGALEQSAMSVMFIAAFTLSTALLLRIYPCRILLLSILPEIISLEHYCAFVVFWSSGGM